MRAAETFRCSLASHLDKRYTLHPVLPAGHARVAHFYRFQFLLQGPHISPVNEKVKNLNSPLPAGIRLTIDVDPIHTFY